jgi:hypothetical protein
MKIQESIKFAKEYCDFSDPNHVWLLKGVSRGKDNTGDYHHFFRRMVLTNAADIESCYDEIKLNGNTTGTTYRIYLSLNSRDVVKANYNFAKKMIDIAHGVSRGLDDQLAKSKKIGSQWKTELEQKSNRGTKRILIDVDFVSSVIDLTSYITCEMNTTIYANRATPNGRAIAIEACDTRGLLECFKDYDVSIQRDAMFFLEQYEGVS